VLIQTEPDGTITFLSPRTKRVLFKMRDGQLIIRERADASSDDFWYIPVPMLARADAVARLGHDPAALEESLGVVVCRP
jgi:hypothetical protein